MLSQEIPCYVHEATKDTGKQCLVTDSWLKRARKMVHSVQKFADQQHAVQQDDAIPLCSSKNKATTQRAQMYCHVHSVHL